MGEDPKTAPGHLVPTGEAPLGTIQMRPGEVLEEAPPIQATVTGVPATTGAPPAMPPARYEIGDEIARGGMGRVVEAMDTVLGRVVALKEALSLDPETLRRFARETKITARLEHPSIVPVHDGGIGPNGTPYYVMRKVSGRPLERLVATAATLNERLALIPNIVAAAHAIAHAHERQVVHRDIKPSNILVGDLGETIVIDWGLAKVIGEADEPVGPTSTSAAEPLDAIKTRAGVVFGTPGFMAPEQLRGNPVDPRCDVYALGATLYHLLSRKPPHHAKTADEMMRAAVNAPPTPIGELVTGVPPELSTIIDTALAHDPEARYQNARELAEDLQRFLTGQLVASHHYSPRERLVRFVKKHRTPFIAGGVALLVLSVIGTLAVVRVIRERDRADAAAVAARKEQKIAETERALAEHRNDQLTLSQARIIADQNPTLAIAMVKPLAAKHWREVRTIAAAARAAGVAWSLPASPNVRSLEMSRDGRRALAAGDDGVVRLYDLEKRTARTMIETGAPVMARFADEERRIVLWAGTKLTTIDVATSSRRDIEVETVIHDLEVVGITAYWIDAQGALWSLDLAGTNPLEVPLDEKMRELSPSPDGRWIALSGENHLYLLDRTQPARPQEVTSGKTLDLDWSTDGGHLAALVDESVFDVLMNPEPQIVHRLTVGERFYVAYSAGNLYTIGPTGVALVSRESSRARRQLTGAPVGLYEARGGTIVAGSEEGIAVISDRGDHTLSIPTGRVITIKASPRSAYVLAAIEGQLLVWNLDEVEPRALGGRLATARFVGSERILATSVDGPAQWIDTATGKATPLGEWPASIAVVASPNGHAAAVVDIAHRAKLLVAGQDAVELDGTADLVGFPTDDTLLIGSTEGVIQTHDLTRNKRTTLLERKDPLIGIAWRRGAGPAWIAGVFADGTLWRKNLASGAEATTRLPKKPTSSLHVLEDGTVLFADHRLLQAWRADETIQTHASLPRPIIDLGAAGRTDLIAFAEDGHAYAVELGRSEQVTDTEQTLGRNTSVSMSADTGLMVVLNRGAIEVLDPLVDHPRWTLASSPGLTYVAPQISTDGRRVLAQTSTSLLVWSLDLPATAATTGAWLDILTNAVTGDGPKSLEWK